MKVLFLTNIPAPYRMDFFNELGKLCELTVSFEGASSTERDSKWVGAAAECYRAVFVKGFRTGRDSFLCFGILKLLKEQWDAVIVGGYSTPTSMLAIEYMRLRGIPFLISADGGFIAHDSKLKYLVKRHFIGAASHWLSSGKATTDYLVHYGAVQEKCFWFPFTSVRKEDLFQAERMAAEGKVSFRRKLGITEPAMILAVGQFVHRKGFDLLIQYASSLPGDCGIYLVGGEPASHYLSMKKQWGADNLHFVGFKSRAELAEYYAAADLFVLPTREDIWGLVVNEAMAFGLPVITTDRCVAGLELVENGKNGYIVPAENAAILREKITELLNKPQTMQSMGQESRRKIQDYTIESMAAVTIRILNQNIGL